MPGFCVSNFSKSCKIDNYRNDLCAYSLISYGDIIVQRNTLNKFINDKVLYQDDDYIVVFEGIVFNESTISNTKWIKKLISLFKKERLFFRNIEGNFSGAIFDKQKKRWIVFTDKLGQKAIFYYYQNGHYVFGSDLQYLTKTLFKNSVQTRLNEEESYIFLTYGCSFDTRTMVKDISRIYPGNYIEIDEKGAIQKSRYAYETIKI